MNNFCRLIGTTALSLVLLSCADQPDHSELHTQLKDAAPLKGVADRKLDPVVVHAAQLLKDGQYKEASALLNRKLQDEPANVGLHILNAMAYEKLAAINGDEGQLDLAIVGYENALNVDPNNLMAITHLGHLRYKKKEYDRAQELFANALLVKPDDPVLLQELAAASYYAYDMKTAEVAIKKAVKEKPDDILGQRSATMIYAALGDFKKSTEHFDAYKKLAGQDPDVNKVAGRMKDWQDLYSSGRIQLAQSNGDFNPMESTDDGSGGESGKQSASLASQALSKALEKGGDGGDAGTTDATTNGAGDGTGDNTTQTSTNTEPNQQIIVDCYLLRIFERGSTSKGQNILKNLEVTLSPGGYLFGTGKISGKGVPSSVDDHPNTLGLSTTFPTQEKNLAIASGGQTIGQFAPSTTFGNKGRMNFTTFVGGLTWSGLTYNLNIANVTDNRNEIIARPSLHTFVGKESVFFSGDELVIGLVGDDGGSLVKYPVGITLVVTPKSLEDDVVSLEVSVEGAEFNDPNPLTQDLTTTVRVGKTRIDTHAKLKLGQTLALGGIYERSEAVAKDGFPGLVDTPILQYFFGNEQSTSERRSVVILMTPRSPDNARKAVELAMARKDNAPSVQELHERDKEWYNTAPNLVQIFKYLAVDPVIYYSFQNGDILPPSWGDPNHHYSNHWEKTLSFLYY